MTRQFRRVFFTLLTLTILLATAFGTAFVLSKGSGVHAASSSNVFAKNATIKSLSVHSVNMATVPMETSQASSNRSISLPLLGAKHSVASTNAPRVQTLMQRINTPVTKAKFKGMADSATICGCEPPDQALAASPNWVLQGVNASFAVYSTTGKIQAGWPKSSQKFFGVPNPGSCSASGPFLSDPRAFYDAKAGRFWAAQLQVEGALGLNNCPEQTFYWVAVSQTNNPNGFWNVYSFNMALGTTNVADYTEFGFDQNAIYFSGNMYAQDGSAYEYAENFSVLKSAMETGSPVTAYGFYDLRANGVLLDTVQPVENEAGTGPGLLINSFNINGDGSNSCASATCSGLVTWAIANPGTSSVSITGVVIASNSYIVAPQADQPGCSACVETLDTRISGTPVYQKGVISFALETGAYNGTQTVPAILWGQVKPTLSGNTITGGKVFQSGYAAFGGDEAASFGALMPTKTGNLLMVFDTMSSTLNPGIVYATRKTTDALGTFEAPLFLQTGLASTFDTRWGDYEATSYDGTLTNNVWFSAQYAGANQDWATAIGKVNF